MKNFKMLIPAVVTALLCTGCGDSAAETAASSPAESGGGVETSSSAVSVSEPQSAASDSTGKDKNSKNFSLDDFRDPNAEKPPMPSTTYVTEENLRILKLLRDFGTFAYSTFPVNYYNYDIVDEGQSEKVSVEGHERTFYKAKDEWIKTLESMTTDKARRALLAYQTPYRVYEKDGAVYLDPTGGAGGIGMGMSELRLDSCEKPDENTLKLNFTSFGDKNEWETSDDIIEKASVVLVKSDGKWLVDEFSWSAVEWLFYYNGINFDGEFYPF